MWEAASPAADTLEAVAGKRSTEKTARKKGAGFPHGAAPFLLVHLVIASEAIVHEAASTACQCADSGSLSTAGYGADGGSYTGTSGYDLNGLACRSAMADIAALDITRRRVRMGLRIGPISLAVR